MGIANSRHIFYRMARLGNAAQILKLNPNGGLGTQSWAFVCSVNCRLLPVTTGVKRIAYHILPAVVIVNLARCVVVLFRLVPKLILRQHPTTAIDNQLLVLNVKRPQTWWRFTLKDDAPLVSVAIAVITIFAHSMLIQYLYQVKVACEKRGLEGLPIKYAPKHPMDKKQLANGGFAIIERGHVMRRMRA
ncbi:hypothetical protein CLF_100840 [Clonorchis sinensis]|uniref:Uncharacterized protein n=1 Tax=Clonorchis sinensis TaxID=79923 RepID=G7Y4D3_CLOSI|nr:hypothetical protein CLF_100840 [Clonorchis sinensis]